VKFVKDWYCPWVRQLTHADRDGDILTVDVIEGNVRLSINDGAIVILTRKQWAKLNRKVEKELDRDD
jgi:hypothetical protein